MPAQPVDLALYASSNTGAALDTLANAFDATWQDAQNEMGTWSFKLPLSDPAVSACTFGRIVRFGLGGAARFAGVIDRVRRTPVSESDEGAESVTVSGRGMLVELAEAKVRAKPASSDAPGAIADIAPAIDERPMDWYGLDYDRSTGWSLATKLADHGETSSVWPGLPGGMRNLGADWIWSASPGPNNEFRFFYQWVNLSAGGYVLDFAAYDAAAYINGKRMGSNASYGEKQRVEFTVVNAGYILLCFEAEKRGAADAGLIWQITAGPEGPLVAASSTAMRVRPPSGDYMTATEILLKLKADHPSLNDWTFDFTATADTDSNDVSGTSAVTARIGDDSVWDILKALSDVYIDFDCSASTKTLKVWEKGTHTTTPTVTLTAGQSTAGIANPSIVNISELEWEKRRAPFNALLVRYDAGWFERPAVLPAEPRWEVLGVPHITSGAIAIEFADALLSSVGVDVDVATFKQLRDMPNADVPYVGYNKWSSLAVPQASNLNATTLTPVKAITCRMDAEGMLDDVIVECGSYVEDAGTRVQRWIARSTRGGLSGQSQVAQGINRAEPTASPPLNQTEIVLFDAIGQSAGASVSRTMPGKGLVHKVLARVNDGTGGTSNVDVTIGTTTVNLTGTTAAGFQLLDIDETVDEVFDPRTVATLDLNTVGHQQITVYAAVSQSR
jgi:hypothetical protein